MICDLPGVQESIKNNKETVPAKHMPKKCENLGAESWKQENVSYYSGATGGR